MKNPLDSALTQNLGLLLARLPLGAYLLFDGYNKFQSGLTAFVHANIGAATHYLPINVAGAVLYSLPVLEVAAGAFLVLGIFSRIGGLLASLVLLTVMLAISGFAGRNGSPFNPNLILFGLAALLCIAGAGSISVERLVWGRRK